MSGATVSDYSTGPSDNSEDENDESLDTSLVYPYPYLGSFYVSHSVLNTLDVNLVSQAIKEIVSTKVSCLQLKPKTSCVTLQYVLFEKGPLSFSTIPG